MAKSAETSVSRKERLVYVLIALVAAALWIGGYFFVGWLSPTRPPIRVDIALDAQIPLVPMMVWPYTLCYVVPLVGPFYAPTRDDFRKGAVSFLLLSLTCFVIYLLFPVKGPRPDTLLVTDWSTWWLAKEYAADTTFNCFPSLHAASAWFFFFVGRHWNRSLTIPLFLVAVGICASALMVRQHYIADIVSGGVMAWFFFRWTFPPSQRTD